MKVTELNLDSAIAAMRREMERHTETRVSGFAIQLVMEPYAAIAEKHLRELAERAQAERFKQIRDLIRERVRVINARINPATGEAFAFTEPNYDAEYWDAMGREGGVMRNGAI